MSNDLVRMSAVLHPLKTKREDFEFAKGTTIQEMLDQARPQGRTFGNVTVFVRGEVVPKRAWSRYRPKPGVLVEVKAYPDLHGGGGGGGKNPLRIILTIATLVVAAWAGPALAGPLFGMGPLTQAATLGLKITASIFTAAVAAGGLLLVNAIAPIRTPRLADLSSAAGQKDSPTLFIDGARNALRPFAPIPQVLGTYRMTPPYGSKPFTEVVGDKQFVRMLFVWGVGPVSIDLSSLKIGETPLTDFDNYQIEHREGYDTDQPLTLFPNAVHQEDMSVLLAQTTSWVTRTSEEDADELSIDITGPQGLVQFDDRGNRTNRQVTFEIEYMQTGTSPAVWQKIDTANAKFQSTIPASWMSKSGDDLVSFTLNHNRTSAIRHGIRWGVDTRGQYDIRIRRTTTDTDSTQIFDEFYLTAVRTITDEDPINSQVPLAVTALVIQATDQLNGIVDEFNGVVTSVCPDYDGGSPLWVEQETQNPASLFRHVLQGNANAMPMADDRLDLERLAEWHQFCVSKGFKFNMVRDFKSSIWETLADIASAGRAAPSHIDGKWTVVIDQEQSLPVSHITPRNSFDFKAQRFFINPPHAWRISFTNENEGYRLDERRVYRDGYDANNATLFEALELPGVTDPDQVFKLGRYRIAQMILQPERWMFKQDMEYLTYERGSRVAITHDVLLVGLKYGRVKSVVLSGSPLVEVAQIVLDEEVEMETGENYGISVRNINGQVTGQVVTTVGRTKTLTLSSPLAGVGSPAEPAVEAGDIFGFGILGQETDDALILSIVPDSSFRAQITAIPYRAAVYNADSEEIPEFETRLTPLRAIPAPQIRSVVSDESAMSLGPGEALKVRIGIDFDPLNEELFGEPELRVQMRPSDTGEPWASAELDTQETNHIFIAGVRTAEIWDIRLRFVVPGRLPGPWSTISSHVVVGKSTPPSPLSGMTISAIGGHALIRWDRPAELDVLFGGEVVFRHTEAFDNPSWAESVSIGQSAQARTLFAVLPLKPGSYLARVYDVAGNPSEEITFVTTKQASVHEFVAVDSLDEAPAWIGSHDGTVEDSGALILDDGASPPVLEGTYQFVSGFDLTTVKRVRLTTRISSVIYDVGSNIDSRTDDIDDWEDFDQALAAGADARVFVRHTDDDPNGSPVNWSAWERLDSAEFEARGFEFYVLLTRDDLNYNISISELGVDVEEVA